MEAEMLLAAGTLHKLPEREGDIRLIEIDEIDLNACGGTHVQATGQIGGLLIRGTERVRQAFGWSLSAACARCDCPAGSGDAHACGRRAVGGSSQVAEAVERLLAEGKAANKARQKLTEELAGYHAARLMLEHPMQEGRRVVRQPLPIMMPAISSCWRRG
jgi:alanyl-tRNA synthetase